MRLQAFLRAFPGRNTITSVCNENLRDGMLPIAELLGTAIGTPCIDAPLADRDPHVAGIQPECSVSDAVRSGGSATRQAIPSCPQRVQAGAACDPGSASTPCWCIHPSAVQCPPDANNPQSHAIEVNRGGVTPAPGTVLEVRCAIATP